MFGVWSRSRAVLRLRTRAEASFVTGADALHRPCTARMTMRCLGGGGPAAPGCCRIVGYSVGPYSSGVGYARLSPRVVYQSSFTVHRLLSEVCINPVPENTDQVTVEKGVNFPTLTRVIEETR